MKKALRSLAILMLLSTFAMFCFGQAESGKINGTLTDPNGAVVRSAKVSIKNVNTGAERNTTTDNAGSYSVTNLQPGTYEVGAQAQGFSNAARRVQVTVGSNITIDIALKPAGQETVVEVTTSSNQVETRTAEQSQVVNSTQISELPTLTRNPYDLVRIAGNVSEADPSGRGVGVAINGQRAASTDVLLDGGENVDTFTAAVGQNVPLDAVQEFRVITSNFSAEYGRASGGIVNVATKSGTNSLHGTVYEFNRISRLAANTYDNSVKAIVKPRFARNQFGYSVGGPIVKDKLFFFSSTEWTRVRSQSTLQALVPTPQFIAAAAPATQAFFTALGTLGTPINGPILLKSNIVTGTGGSGAFTPAPGGSFAALPANTPIFGTVNYVVPSNAGGGTPQNTYSMVQRVDYNLSSKTILYVRYARENQLFLQGSNNSSPYAGYNTGSTQVNDNGLINVTHIFSPTLVSSTKLVYNRLNNLQPLGAAPVGPTLYFQGTTRTTFGGIKVAGPGYSAFSPGNAIPFGGPQNLYQIFQDLSWSKGNHQLRIGGQYVHARDNRAFGAFEEAVENLSTQGKPLAFDNFLDGKLDQFQAAVNPQGKFPCPTDAANVTQVTPGCTLTLPVGAPQFNRNNRYHDWAIYAQDSWKLLPRFTLDIGVRYEYYGVQHNVDPTLDSNFFYGSGATVFDQIRNGAVQLAPNSPVGGLWAPQKKNFAPRLGFAWDVFGDGKTSFRGGFGIGYERNFGNVTFNVIQNPPNYAVIALTPSDVGGTINVTSNNAGPLAGSTGTKALPKTSLRWVDQNIKTAYAEFYGASLEHELARNTVVSLEYSGSHGVKLYSLENPNRRGSGVIYGGDLPTAPTGTSSRLNRQYTSVNRRGGAGFSHYDSLNAKLQTNNFANSGVQLTANYTISHAIDNLSSTFSEANNNFNLGLLDPYNPGLDRGNADFDVRNRFSLSALWEIPWGKKSSNSLVKYALGGWSLTPIYTASSGTPYTIFNCDKIKDACPRLITDGISGGTGTVNGTPVGLNVFNYLQIPTPIIVTNPATGSSDFGSSCATPGSGRNGPCLFDPRMAQRNSFRGPGVWDATFAIYKNLPITERIHVQLRSEFFNVFNHHNYYVIGDGTDASGFVPTAPSQVQLVKGCPAGSCGSNQERRNVQFGAKIIF